MGALNFLSDTFSVRFGYVCSVLPNASYCAVCSVLALQR